MPTPGRSNNKTLPAEVDQVLLAHLVSPNRLEKLSFLEGSIKYNENTTRKKVQNRLEYFKKLKQNQVEEFLDLCLGYSISIDFDSIEEDLLNEDSSSKSSAPAPSPAPPSPAPPSPTQRTGASSKTKKKKRSDPALRNLMEDFDNMGIGAAPRGATCIEVNKDFPEKHGELLVVPTKDIPGIDGKTFYEGFTIFHRVDPQWMLKYTEVEFLEGRLLSSNSILLKCPSTSYSVLHNKDEFDKGLNAYSTDALDNWRHSFFEDKRGREVQYLALDFGSDCELSAKKIHGKAGENEVLEMKIQNKSVFSKQLNLTFHEFWVSWTVARVDVLPNKKGKVDTTIKKSNALSLLIDLGVTNGMAQDDASL
jgi:hypothetical protein